jgi:sec-independent protein translocase protein TatB
MFDIGWSELLVIGVVALIVIGPKELPGVLRAVGHWMGKVRRMASEFQDQFREAMREAEVADLKRQFDEASAKATSAFTNPLEVAQKEVDAAFGSDPTVLDKSADTPAETPAIASADSGAAEPSPAAPLDIAPEPAIAEAESSADHVKPAGSGAA